MTADRHLDDYLHACLGDIQGRLHIAIGYGGHFNGTGRYQFDRFVQSHFAFPGETGQAVREMLAAAPESDVYLCPYVMHSDKRTPAAVVARDHVHADIDHGHIDAEVDKIQALHGFAVASGTPGNGQVYVALTEPIPANWHKILCRGLGDHLGGGDAKISANDVLRPPGTFNHKSAAKDGGAPTPVQWLVRPPGVRVDPQALAQLLGVTLPDQVSAAVKTSPVGVDVELPIEFNIDDHPKVKAALQQVTDDRSVDTMRVVGACRRSGLTVAHARYAVNTRSDLAARLDERRDDDVAECWRKTAAENIAEDSDEDSDEDSAGWLSDANISALLVNRVLRGKYCWAKGLGWMRFDGKKWSRTADQDVIEQSRRFANTLVAEVVAKKADPDKIRAYTRRLSAGAVRAAADLAKGQLLIDAALFDRHPDLLNVANGVIDLRTGKLGPHDAELLFTYCTPTEYHPGATDPDWDKALSALPPDVADWMQLRFGQAITGHPTPDDVLPVLHGAGANGKTTITIGIVKALGEYAMTVPDRVLLANPGDHPTEMMTLRGARFALLEETPEARHLNVKRLKDVLGTPRMTARYIAQDSVTWDATHSLFVSTNYRPRVDEVDHGTWRRLALVSFPYTFRRDGEVPFGPLCNPNDRRGDDTLRDRIKAGRDGQHEAILRWLVDGARRWYAAGQVMPAPPTVVAADTRGWRRDSDLILRWFDDNLIADPKFYIPGTEHYEAFTDWLTANGHQKWTAQTFADRFAQHDEISGAGIVHHRIRPSTTLLHESRPVRSFGMPAPLPERFRAWIGVRFRTDEDERAESRDQEKHDLGTAGTDGLGDFPKNTHMENLPNHPSRPSQGIADGVADDEKAGVNSRGFNPPVGAGRCPDCRWHPATQGHAPNCPANQ